MMLLSGSVSGTEGVSKEGMEELLNQINVVMIDEVKSNLANYASFESTLRTYWQGADCDAWMENFVKLSQEISDALQSYYDQIEAEFNKVFTSWEEFQANHVSQG